MGTSRVMTSSAASGPGVAAFAACLAAGAVGTAVLRNPAPFFVGAAVGVIRIFFYFSSRIS
jgi:hypothetical protein